MSSSLNPDGFFKPITDYKTLLFYKKTVVLYDMTYFFVNRYLERGDRTIDQMVQAARSGKQNIWLFGQPLIHAASHYGLAERP